MSSPFSYIGEDLHAENVSLAAIAAELGTPFYCYSTRALTESYDAFAAAVSGLNADICYSVKANSNIAVIATLAARGAGADVVSEGELRRALAAGVPARKIVFSGVGKTAAELAAALDAGIMQINVESEPELETLARVARERGRTAPVALRVNPDVDAETHHKIATGRSEDKFGIEFGQAAAMYRRGHELAEIDMVGLAVHIGSQLTSVEPFRRAYEHVATLALSLRAAGLPVKRLDLGGGLGIVYSAETPPDVRAYAEMVTDVTRDLDVAIAFEPGRLIAGNAGVLVTAVVYDKQGATRRHVIVDAAMNDLLRPTLYGAYHDILPVRKSAGAVPKRPADVVGPVCETGDVLAHDRDLPPFAQGDLLAVMSCGAYGAVMASEYNSRQIAPEVLVNANRYSVIRKRTPYAIMIERDRMPPWLAGAPAQT